MLAETSTMTIVEVAVQCAGVGLACGGSRASILPPTPFNMDHCSLIVHHVHVVDN